MRVLNELNEDQVDVVIRIPKIGEVFLCLCMFLKTISVRLFSLLLCCLFTKLTGSNLFCHFLTCENALDCSLTVFLVLGILHFLALGMIAFICTVLMSFCVIRRHSRA